MSARVRNPWGRPRKSLTVRFPKMPKGWWRNKENQRKFVEWFAAQRSIDLSTPKDLYRIRWSELVKYGGNVPMSVSRFLINIFPEHDWEPWKFRKPPPNIWESIAIRRRYLEWVAKKLKLKSPEDWYSVTSSNLKRLKGAMLLKKYHKSIACIVSTTLTEFDWKKWLFVSCSPEWWMVGENQRKYFEALFQHLKYQSLEDWYAVHYNAIANYGGGAILLGLFNDDLCRAVMTIYPEHVWHPWKFRSLPKHWWEEIDNQSFYLTWLREELRLFSEQDWYNLQPQQLNSNYGRALLNLYDDNIGKAVMTALPRLYLWKPWRFSSNPRNWWASPTNIRAFFDWYLEFVLFTADVTKLSNLTVKDVEALGAQDLLLVNKLSLPELITLAYPGVTFHFDFHADLHLPRAWSNDQHLRHVFLQWLARRLNITDMEKWYDVTYDDFVSHGGGTFLKHYGDSPAKLLMSNFTNHLWRPWKFRRTPKNYWLSATNVKAFLDDVVNRKFSGSLEGLYTLHMKTLLEEKCGNDFVKLYPYVSDAAMFAYPSHKWHPWKFTSLNPSWWDSLSHQQMYITYLAESQNLKPYEDYYALIWPMIESTGGGRLRLIYNEDISVALSTIFPQHKWFPWKFVALPSMWWHSDSNKKTYFLWLYQHLGFSSMDDWYSVNSEMLASNYGTFQVLYLPETLLSLHQTGQRLLQIYQNTPSAAIMAAFPEHQWQGWRFARLPKGFWTNINNQRAYLNWLAEKLNFTSMEDWYTLTRDALILNKGQVLYLMYERSIPSMLESVFPEHNWLGWRFVQLPSKYWHSEQNQLRYCEWLKTKLNFTSMDCWYQVTGRTFIENEGSGLLNHFNGSVSALLQSVYPNHSWQPWRFCHTPQGYWDDVANSGDPKAVSELINFIAKQLDINVTEPHAWSKVSITDIKRLDSAAYGAICKLGGLHIALKMAFPEHDWSTILSSATAPPKNQGRHKQLLQHTETLFPNDCS